ncbi:ribosome biogenesis GTP-binding protein YihA/YsxC [Verrucomicrobiales bacterium BCK34]|nr:ribosome biogenesis GTP-binding protein YihA/YsxC [Verrucomicrobiales bacterium BCK34]
MKITSATFHTSAAGLEACPPSELPEFAFIGRSNVGKSSLLNMLCNHKGLAKVSQKPGHTRLINFFVVNKEWALVDLPGYGYAKAAKAERYRFNDFVADYLESREELSHVFVLIDSRHSPMKNDLDFVSWLVEVGVPFSLVFTKSDKLKKGKIEKNRQAFLEAMKEFSEGEPPTFITSAANNDGRNDVLRFIGEKIRGGI